ncbi:hypothetical protein EVAR_69899_1 [Eumeta japonica]|uniref:Uncharacterized protein n=1 Tax=Eumeta variegata TaxID=151549 RepID=A0A4C1SVJ1_EUMVA|nr:hypothetical protein EVAR_69899_1 [Eumeta japonica]
MDQPQGKSSLAKNKRNSGSVSSGSSGGGGGNGSSSGGSGGGGCSNIRRRNSVDSIDFKKAANSTMDHQKFATPQKDINLSMITSNNSESDQQNSDRVVNDKEIIH